MEGVWLPLGISTAVIFFVSMLVVIIHMARKSRAPRHPELPVNSLGIAILDAEGMFTEVNETFTRMFTCPSQIPAAKFSDFLIATEVSPWLLCLEQWRTEMPERWTHNMMMYGNDRRPVSTNVTMWPLKGMGEKTRIFVELRQLNSPRQRNLDDRCDVFQSSSVPLGIVEIIGYEIFNVVVNSAWLRTCAGRALDGRVNCREFGVSDADVTWFRSVYDTARLTGQTQVRELSVRRGKDLQWYSFVADYMGEVQGGHRYSFASIDITDRKNAELAALEVTKAKSAFLAQVAHEIRTPLHGIAFISSLLKKTELQPRQLEYTNVLNISSESILGIVNDMLDFSKIEAGKMDLNQKDFLLREFIEETLLPFEYQAKIKNIQLIRQIDSVIPYAVHGDPLRIRQILSNLLSNALKFTHRGKIVFGFYSNSDNDSRHARIKFSVEDEGIGMSREAISRLFNPFEQADGSTAGSYGGTGLGLAISKSLAEQMSGELLLRKSSLGAGSLFEFKVELPIVETPILEAPVEDHEDALSGRVLVVEDHPINRMVAANVLASIGLEAVIVANGREALDALHGQVFDLVLMDCQMPEVDGYEATRRIRSGLPGIQPDLPIIAMSANGLKVDIERCFTVGMDDYLSKPANEREIRLMIHKWIHRKSRMTADPTNLDLTCATRMMDYATEQSEIASHA